MVIICLIMPLAFKDYLIQKALIKDKYIPYGASSSYAPRITPKGIQGCCYKGRYYKTGISSYFAAQLCYAPTGERI